MRAAAEIAALRRQLAAIAGEATAGIGGKRRRKPGRRARLRSRHARHPKPGRPVGAPANGPRRRSHAPDEPPPRPPRDLEALLTQRWGLWLGAAALLLSGVFLIRYAVENALIGPAARCAAAALLGVALLAGAEWLRRRPPAGGAHRRRLPPAAWRCCSGPPTAPACSTLCCRRRSASHCWRRRRAAGLLASLRYGQLAAAVGVAGAFATPALMPTADPRCRGCSPICWWSPPPRWR